MENDLTRRDAVAWPDERYAWYVVAVLHIAALLSYIDRLILSLLIEPVRTDLQISDTQIALVTGTAFAVFYGVMVLPMGRWADSGNRTRIIAIGILAWSLLTAACGLARNFWQLFLTRIGVGIGEASLAGSAYSLLSDYFPPLKLPIAMSVYVAAALFGSGLALMTGGWVIQAITAAEPWSLPWVGTLQPWQATFVAVALPGLPVGLLVLTIREPFRRGRLHRDISDTARERAIPLRQVIAYLWGHRLVFFPHFFGFAIGGIYAYSVFIWTPTFFIRTFDWTPAQAGIRFGSVVLVFGVTGTFLGGWLATHWMKRGQLDALFRVAILSMLVLGPVAVFAPLAPSSSLALGGFSIAVLLFSMAAAVAPTALQLVAPNELRGQTSSVFSFMSIMVGLGAGPTLVALLTDRVFGSDESLRYSLSIIGGAAALGCACVLNLGRSAFRDAVLAARDRWNEVPSAP